MRPRIETYAEFEQITKKFAEGHFNLLLIDGRAGVGKSETILKATKKMKAACLLKGHLTALAFYEELYRHRDKPIIIDDIDTLLRNKDIVKILKCLCDSKDTKKLMWSSRSNVKTAGAPSSFETVSKACVILNCCGKSDKNQKALYDRGLVIEFAPNSVEVHAQAGKWFKDKAVYDFIGANLTRCPDLSFRHYVVAKQTKDAGLDWQKYLLQDWAEHELADCLNAVQKGGSGKDQEAAYKESTGKSRATFYRQKKRLSAPVPRPNGRAAVLPVGYH